MQLGSVLLTDQRWKTNTVSERYTKWNTHQPFAAIPENRSDFCFYTSTTSSKRCVTSEVFLFGVSTVFELVVVLVASRRQQTHSGLRQQVLQLTAQQVQQRLQHLRT